MELCLNIKEVLVEAPRRGALVSGSLLLSMQTPAVLGSEVNVARATSQTRSNFYDALSKLKVKKKKNDNNNHRSLRANRECYRDRERALESEEAKGHRERARFFERVVPSRTSIRSLPSASVNVVTVYRISIRPRLRMRELVAKYSRGCSSFLFYRRSAATS